MKSVFHLFQKKFGMGWNGIYIPFLIVTGKFFLKYTWIKHSGSFHSKNAFLQPNSTITLTLKYFREGNLLS